MLEPYNKRPFVRFHAFQCIGLAVCAFALGMLMIIPILGWIVGIVGDLVLFVVWILCIVKASQGQRWKVPLIGNYIENIAR